MKYEQSGTKSGRFDSSKPNYSNPPNRLYVLNHWGYDESTKWLFFGPDIGGEEEWKAFVDSLMPDAARQAMKNEVHEDGTAGYVGSYDIMGPLVERIKEQGYEELDPPGAGYGAVIIYKERDRGRLPLGDAEDAVIAHTDEAEKALDRHCKKMRTDE